MIETKKLHQLIYLVEVEIFYRISDNFDLLVMLDEQSGRKQHH